jgi:hypothetical protein
MLLYIGINILQEDMDVRKEGWGPGQVWRHVHDHNFL